MKKLAIIRGSDVASCPYGLTITGACHSAGNAVLQMRALSLVEENEIEKAHNSNQIIYMTQKGDNKCVFANEIMDRFNKVDCSWGDVGAGEGTAYLPASPLYPRTFVGVGTSPSVRMDNDNISDPRLTFEGPDRGIDVPFGLFSIFASPSNQDAIIKIAISNTNSRQSTNNTTPIKDKLAYLKNKYLDTLELIFNGVSPIKLNNETLKQLMTIINNWS